MHGENPEQVRVAEPGPGPLSLPQLVQLEHKPELGERFIDALVYATRVHAGQRKKSDLQPYIGHLLRVQPGWHLFRCWREHLSEIVPSLVAARSREDLVDGFPMAA